MMKNKVAYILIGPSGSGKSTYIEQLKKDHEGQDLNVFSLDQCRLAYYSLYGGFENSIMCGRPLLRFMSFGDVGDRDEANKFYNEAFDFCNKAGKDFDAFVTENWIDMRNNSDVLIVDNTNVSKKSRTRWVNDLRNMKTANQFGFHIVMVEFLVPLDTLHGRQSTRPDKFISHGIVNQQFFRYEGALLGSECDEVRIITSQDREVLGDSNALTSALVHHKRFVQSKADEQAAKAAK